MDWVFALFCLMFLPFLWRWNNTTMISPETYLPLDPGRELRFNLHVWYEQGRTGYPWLLYTALPYTTLLAIFQGIGHSVAVTQRFLFGLLFAIAGTSIYWLVLNLQEYKRFACFGAVVAALFYVLNPFFVYTFHWVSDYTLAMALLPLAMAFYLWAWQKIKKILDYNCCFRLLS